MLTNRDIKKLSGTTIYNRGEDLFLSGGVLQFNMEEKEGEHHISARVRGSGRKVYDVVFSYDTFAENLMETSCSCPAFCSYPGICKHCVAVLLAYTERIQELQPRLPLTEETRVIRTGSGHSIREKKISTTPEMKQLLSRKQAVRALPVQNRELWGKVRLEPSFFLTDREFTVEFKVGVSHLYIIKDVFGFAERMKTGAIFSYGQKLMLPHDPGVFEPASGKFLAWIMDWTKANRGRYEKSTYRGYLIMKEVAKVRRIPLNGDLLERLIELSREEGIYGEVFDSVMRKWTVTEEKPERKLTVSRKSSGLEVSAQIWPEVLMSHYSACFQDGRIYLTPMEEMRPITDFFDCMNGLPGHRAFIEKEDVPLFFRELLPELKQCFDCELMEVSEADFGVYPAQFRYYLDAPQRDMITGRLLVSYGEKEYNVFDRLKETGNRDLPREALAGEALSDYCNAFEEENCRMVLAGDEDRLYELLQEGIVRMQSFGEVFISDALKRMETHRSLKTTVGISLSGDLLELTVTVADMDREELLEILSRYDRKRKYFRLKDGSFLNREDEGLTALYELKQGLDLKDRDFAKEHMTIPRYRALYLDGELRDKPFLGAVRDRAYRQLVRNMRTVEDNDFEIPASLEPILREYQKQGYRWLKTLKENGFGGILADDMGLGKTLQVIALLLSEFLEAGAEENRRCLIVTPASLVYNWHHEIIRFAPALPVKMVVGTAEEREHLLARTGSRDILITSYDLLRRDLSFYKKIKFNCQVIDEAQFIKNHNTQASRAVREIQADFRLALTGTPIENRLSELWSIFDYLMPGFLYSYQRFREELELPIVQEQDKKAMERLQKMIRPFVLRRLKKEVLTELPDKLEENMFAPLSREQQKLYDAHVKRLRLLLDHQTEEEFRTGKIQILSELTRLRQLCCDPALLYENYEEESAKTRMCMELIENAVGAGHKILLFSQFTSMLEILEEELEKANISYYALTGSTGKEKRLELVEAFNHDDTRVFCISLKAGGTGLNLTSADIVIHYDPWWNLAVQNQATDRAHRIGQQNVVSVYRLLTQGTIEEKIMQLQEKKKELAEQVLSGEGLGSGSFTREELLELLE